MVIKYYRIVGSKLLADAVWCDIMGPLPQFKKLYQRTKIGAVKEDVLEVTENGNYRRAFIVHNPYILTTLKNAIEAINYSQKKT